MPAPTELTVIVCSRERPDMLARSLASIVAATPLGAEILVVDSASTGSATLDVAADAGVRAVRSDVSGLSIARNLGLASTDRPYVLYTDDDCVALDGWTDRILRHFDDPRVGAVTGRMLDHTLVTEPSSIAGVDRLERTLDGLDGGHGALMGFRRELILGLGGFDEVLGAGREFAGAEDLDAFCRVLQSGYALVHDEGAVVHHVNTREGEAYTDLHRGYGLGLGAMANKWIRTRPTVGIPMLGILLKRTAVRAVRHTRHARRGAADRAMLRGILAGLARSTRMRLDGERFVDDHRPTPVSPAAEPGRAGLA
ncbi:glycosyltransferase family 2 protein [Agromyces larvae]|uniref:Glycosyltransferase n=1 Tax=Agromyces larvae TaxID=2929802 RepID=A0ABY4C2U3_9MICO|nr:glycosyltransferase [Agromyces larvae]UOE44336.1 glycosyltransferase [Agromyces larvae]